MPQITLYIPKAMDEAWRSLDDRRRKDITDRMRSLLNRRLAGEGAYDAQEPRTGAKGAGAKEVAG